MSQVSGSVISYIITKCVSVCVCGFTWQRAQVVMQALLSARHPINSSSVCVVELSQQAPEEMCWVFCAVFSVCVCPCVCPCGVSRVQDKSSAGEMKHSLSSAVPLLEQGELSSALLPPFSKPKAVGSPRVITPRAGRHTLAH